MFIYIWSMSSPILIIIRYPKIMVCCVFSTGLQGPNPQSPREVEGIYLSYTDAYISKVNFQTHGYLDCLLCKLAFFGSDAKSLASGMIYIREPGHKY